MDKERCLLTLSLLVILVQANDPVIETQSGKIKGTTIRVLNTDIDVFLGIPFAKPPVGDLRFRRPEKVEPWKGVKDAQTPPNSCMQIIEKVKDYWNVTTSISEDCLYINLWVPAGARQSASKRATMIWIYGGSFTSGTITLDLYDGRWLAASQNVIVASLNYRVGAFGFLYLNEKRAPGNMGLLDQNLAIQWIHNNTEAFGGSADKVTLFGESAGSASVSYHVVSPLSTNYFRNAIMMSGSMTAKWALESKENNIAKAKKMAASLKCPVEDTDAILDCLLKADAGEITKAQLVTISSIYDITFIPVIDNYFLPENLQEILPDPKIKKKDVLLGFVKDEATIFLFLGYPKYFHLDGPVSLDKAVAEKITRTIINSKSKINSIQIDFIFYLYGSSIFRSEIEKYIHVLDSVWSDKDFKCPMVEFAQILSEQSNVYMYSFEHRSTVYPLPEWVGVFHGSDIEFVFGRSLAGKKNYTKAEEVLTARMSGFWSNFSKSGNPNNGECGNCTSDAWPKFTSKQQKYIVLDTVDNFTIRQGYNNDICGCWSNSYPKLGNCDTSGSSQTVFTSYWSLFTCTLTSLLVAWIHVNTL